MARKNGPIVVCIINMKGGVGKSTITALLARNGAVSRNLDVLAVDLDPQANLSQALMNERYSKFLKDRRPSIVEVFNGYTPPNSSSASPTPLDAGDVVQSIFRWDKRSLELIPSRFDFSDNLTNAIRPDERALARFLASNFKHKDIIFIDCAPTESVLTQAAYHASGLVLIPVKPEYFATIGFPLLAQSLTNFRSRNRGHKISVAGIVINNGFYDGGNNGGPEKVRALKEIVDDAAKNKWNIYGNQIPFSRGFPKKMRGDFSHSGNSDQFVYFATEFYKSIGM